MSSIERTLKVRSDFCHIMDLRDRVVGSGSPQQARLSVGSDLVNRPIHPFDHLSKKVIAAGSELTGVLASLCDLLRPLYDQ